MSIKHKIVKINDKNGLHLRAAAKIAEKSRQYDASVKLCKDDQCADGASVMELLMLDAGSESKIRLEVSGNEAERMLEELSIFFIDGAGI